MSQSDKQIAGNQRRTLRTMRIKLLAMASEWDGLDQFNMSQLVELADKAHEVASLLVADDATP
jgi:hypothetical protein